MAGGSFGGGNGSAGNPYLVEDAADLDAVRNYLASHFRQTADIDISGYSNWNPIGTISSPFTGVYDGDNHIVSSLTINRSANTQGLFGETLSSADIKNLTLTNVNVVVTGYSEVGSLIGYNSGAVTNCRSSGVVTGGYNYAGGLIGYNNGGTIRDCTFSGDVNCTGNDYAGGLIGYNEGGNITNCTSSGTVAAGDDFAGGLIGENRNATLTNCSSSCAVSVGSDYAGGLIGSDYGGSISNCQSTGNVGGYGAIGGFIGAVSSITDIQVCYSTGDVVGGLNGWSIGGFAGDDYGGSTISECYADGAVSGGEGVFGIGGFVGIKMGGTTSNCYAKGNVSGATGTNYADEVGGFIGLNATGWGIETSTIDKCYSIGLVTGDEVNAHVGGFAGDNWAYGSGTPIISGCYYDTDTSGQSDNTGKGVPKTTAEMKSQPTFVGWDFTNIWGILTNQYPFLRVFGGEIPSVNTAATNVLLGPGGGLARFNRIN